MKKYSWDKTRNYFSGTKLRADSTRSHHRQRHGRRDSLSRFLMAETHPFADGNGRVERIAINAELVASAQVRIIIIPTVLRLNYLSALKAATHNVVFAR